MVRIRLGISTCLLGEKVRYDGGHKRDRFLTDTLTKFVDYVPVCPEVECGLPVPREPMRLVGDPTSPRLVTIRTGRDLTDQMERWSHRRLRELERDKLDGFVFKSRSPSCGTAGVKVYDEQNVPHEVGCGIFAREFIRHFPLLFVAEDEQLDEPSIRQSLLDRVLGSG